MRVIRVDAVQAHPVPKHAYYPPSNVFSRDVTADPEIVYDYQSEDDEGTSSLGAGATAQNNYKAPKYYRCRTCSARVTEDEISSHECEYQYEDLEYLESEEDYEDEDDYDGE